MKVVLQAALALACCLATAAKGQTNPSLAAPHLADFSGHADYADRPMGAFGLRLGTFAVIEGTTTKSSMRHPYSFSVESVNGQRPKHPIDINTEWSPRFTAKAVPGKRYVLHGYETGRWAGEPVGLPKNEDFSTQLGGFFFAPIFKITSIEKVDGVTVADARPLDPSFHLVQPSFDAAAKSDASPPVGVLGLHLGTFAIIEVQPPRHPYMLGNAYEVVRVNGVDVDPPRVISIPGLEATNFKRKILHGFETGEWISQPELPASEDPHRAEVQQLFQFEHQFFVTSTEK